MPGKPKPQAPGTGAVIIYPQPAAQVHDALQRASSEEVLSVSLNGKEVKAVKGETIIEVCHREDVYVPHYCWHPSLSIAGNCRLCLVEVEKQPKPVIACQTHVMPGMVIKTESKVAKECQEGMMEFLLVNHPLDCPICDRGGECQLQRYSMEYGQGHARMADKKRKFIKPQADPLIDIERNRCIMCTRCVRFCDEVGGEHVMGVFDRGDGNYIGTFGQGPVSNIFSGNVIDLCPVGCLTSRPFRFKARAWELKQTQSTCDQCSSGCKITSWTRNGKLYRTTPPSRKRLDHFTINEDTEEFICNQGRFAGDYGRHETRQDESLVRKAGRLVPTAFEDAVKQAAALIKQSVDKHGADSTAVLVSPRATLEEGYLAATLARRVLKTSNIDWRASFINGAAANAVSLALSAADGDLGGEVDVVIVLNGNLVAQSPVLAMRIQELGRRVELPIIMLGHHHDSYISSHASARAHWAVGETPAGLDRFTKAIAEGDSNTIASMFGISTDGATKLVDTVRNAKKGVLVHGLEDFGGLHAPADVPAAIRTRKTLGDKWGYLPVVRDRNAVGLHRVGAEPAANGVGVHGIVEAIEGGRIRSLVLFGTDSIAALGDMARVRAALQKLDSLVVIDPFRSEYNERADVFIALASNIERSGVYADIEGNLALLAQAEDTVGDSRPGWQILSGLGRALGSGDFGGNSAAECWDRTRSFLAPRSTATYRDLELEGGTNTAQNFLMQKSGGARNRGTEYNPGNYRTDGLHLRGNAASIAEDRLQSASVSVPAGDGLVLVWGPHVSGRGYLNDRASISHVLLPKAYLELNPADAARLGARTDQFAIMSIEGARAKVAIKISMGAAPGTVYLSSGIHGQFDPAVAGGPARVTLELLDEEAPDQGRALVGAGVSDSH